VKPRRPPPPEADEEELPVRIVPPATAEEEADAWRRLFAALAWLARRRMDA
jgi:hypothetical protein